VFGFQDHNTEVHEDERNEATLQTPHFMYFLNIYVLNFLNMLHNLCFFSAKCLYFIMLPFFGSCIIRILNTGCAKI
jgi:hypothetical protein